LSKIFSINYFVIVRTAICYLRHQYVVQSESVIYEKTPGN